MVKSELLVTALEKMEKEELAALGTILAEGDTESLLAVAREIYWNRFCAKVTKMDALLEAGTIEAATIEDGTYTIVLNGDSDYVTLKIATAKAGSALSGKRIISYLSGPDNELNFTGFAFLTEDMKPIRWKKFQGSEAIDRTMQAVGILLGAESSQEFQEAYALKAGRCAKCNRKLTVPSSINRALGPECATKI